MLVWADFCLALPACLGTLLKNVQFAVIYSCQTQSILEIISGAYKGRRLSIICSITHDDVIKPFVLVVYDDAFKPPPSILFPHGCSGLFWSGEQSLRVTRVSHSRAGAFRLAVSLQTEVSLSFLPLLCFQPLT